MGVSLSARQYHARYPANVIAHTRRTGGFTIAASEAATRCSCVLSVTSLPSSTCLIRRCARAARPVHRPEADRLGRFGTKSAVNTGAQDAVGFQRAPFCRISSVNWVCIACSSKFRYMRPGLNTPQGSSCCLSCWCSGIKEPIAGQSHHLRH